MTSKRAYELPKLVLGFIVVMLLVGKHAKGDLPRPVSAAIVLGVQMPLVRVVTAAGAAGAPAPPPVTYAQYLKRGDQTSWAWEDALRKRDLEAVVENAAKTSSPVPQSGYVVPKYEGAIQDGGTTRTVSLPPALASRRDDHGYYQDIGGLAIAGVPYITHHFDPDEYGFDDSLGVSEDVQRSAFKTFDILVPKGTWGLHSQPAAPNYSVRCIEVKDGSGASRLVPITLVAWLDAAQPDQSAWDYAFSSGFAHRDGTDPRTMPLFDANPAGGLKVRDDFWQLLYKAFGDVPRQVVVLPHFASKWANVGNIGYGLDDNGMVVDEGLDFGPPASMPQFQAVNFYDKWPLSTSGPFTSDDVARFDAILTPCAAHPLQYSAPLNEYHRACSFYPVTPIASSTWTVGDENVKAYRGMSLAAQARTWAQAAPGGQIPYLTDDHLAEFARGYFGEEEASEFLDDWRAAAATWPRGILPNTYTRLPAPAFPLPPTFDAEQWTDLLNDLDAAVRAQNLKDQGGRSVDILAMTAAIGTEGLYDWDRIYDFAQGKSVHYSGRDFGKFTRTQVAWLSKSVAALLAQEDGKLPVLTSPVDTRRWDHLFWDEEILPASDRCEARFEAKLAQCNANYDVNENYFLSGGYNNCVNLAYRDATNHDLALCAPSVRETTVRLNDAYASWWNLGGRIITTARQVGNDIITCFTHTYDNGGAFPDGDSQRCFTMAVTAVASAGFSFVGLPVTALIFPTVIAFPDVLIGVSECERTCGADEACKERCWKNMALDLTAMNVLAVGPHVIGNRATRFGAGASATFLVRSGGFTATTFSRLGRSFFPTGRALSVAKTGIESTVLQKIVANPAPAVEGTAMASSNLFGGKALRRGAPSATLTERLLVQKVAESIEGRGLSASESRSLLGQLDGALRANGDGLGALKPSTRLFAQSLAEYWAARRLKWMGNLEDALPQISALDSLDAAALQRLVRDYASDHPAPRPTGSHLQVWNEWFAQTKAQIRIERADAVFGGVDRTWYERWNTPAQDVLERASTQLDDIMQRGLTKEAQGDTAAALTILHGETSAMFRAGGVLDGFADLSKQTPTVSLELRNGEVFSVNDVIDAVGKQAESAMVTLGMPSIEGVDFGFVVRMKDFADRVDVPIDLSGRLPTADLRFTPTADPMTFRLVGGDTVRFLEVPTTRYRIEVTHLGVTKPLTIPLEHLRMTKGLVIAEEARHAVDALTLASNRNPWSAMEAALEPAERAAAVRIVPGRLNGTATARTANGVEYSYSVNSQDAATTLSRQGSPVMGYEGHFAFRYARAREQVFMATGTETTFRTHHNYSDRWFVVSEQLGKRAAHSPTGAPGTRSMFDANLGASFEEVRPALIQALENPGAQVAVGPTCMGSGKARVGRATTGGYGGEALWEPARREAQAIALASGVLPRDREVAVPGFDGRVVVPGGIFIQWEVAASDLKPLGAHYATLPKGASRTLRTLQFVLPTVANAEALERANAYLDLRATCRAEGIPLSTTSKGALLEAALDWRRGLSAEGVVAAFALYGSDAKAPIEGTCPAMDVPDAGNGSPGAGGASGSSSSGGPEAAIPAGDTASQNPDNGGAGCH